MVVNIIFHSHKYTKIKFELFNDDDNKLQKKFF